MHTIDDAILHILSIRDDESSYERMVRSALLQDVHPWVKPVAMKLARRCALKAKAVSEAFLATLDPDLLRVIRLRWRPLSLDPAMLDRSICGSSSPAAACLAYPTVAGSLLERWERCHDDLPLTTDATDEWDAVVRRALDEDTDFPPWIIARAPGLNAMVKADPSSRGAPLDGKLHAEMDVLLRMPPSWAPSTQEEWSEYAAARRVIRHAEHYLANKEDIGAFVSSKGRWGEWLAALRLEDGAANPLQVAGQTASAFTKEVLAPFIDPDTIYIPANHLNPFTNEFTLLPMGWTPDHIGFDVMWSGTNLKSVCDMTRRWQRARPGIEARILSLSDTDVRRYGTWDAGLVDHRTGDLWMHVMTTPDELVAEGHNERFDGVRGLSHCIGGYAGRCRSGMSRIVSVRRMLAAGGWARVSTAEINVRNGALIMHEHRAYKDSKPPKEADAAMEEYVAMCSDGRLPVEREAFRAVPEPSDGSTYDWTVDGSWEAVLEAWRPCLPSRIARLDRDAFASIVTKARADKPGWHPRHILDGR